MRTLCGFKPKLVLACLVTLGVLAAVAGGSAGLVVAAGYAPLCPGLESPAFCQPVRAWAFMVAVDNSSEPTAGDVYMTTLGVGGNSGVWRFGPFGEEVPFTGANPNLSGNELRFPGLFIGAVGIALDSAGDFYVTPRETNTVEEFTPAGEPVSSFSLPGGTVATGVAVDNSGGPSNGDIYIANETGGLIYKFKPGGELITQSTVEGAHPLTPYSLAVDSAGHVYAANQNGGEAQKFSEALVFEGVLGEANDRAVAIDPSTGDIFIAYADEHVQQYSPAGAPIGAPFSPLSEANGIAVSGVGPAAHFLYGASLSGSAGVMFGEGEGPEAPTTGLATEVQGRTAVLHGVVDPGGPGTVGYHFAFNTGGVCEGGSTTTQVPRAPRDNEAVQSEAAGLLPRTEYTYCLVATNTFGHAHGAELTFTTQAAKPLIEEEAASEETTGSARISANINPSGAETTCKVEYGHTSVSEAQQACSASLPEGTSAVPVSFELSGLESDQTYHYRIVATNSAGTTEAEEKTFKTTAVLALATEAASEVLTETATLKGTVTPGPEGAKYFFEYGTVSVGEHRTAEVTASGAGPVSVQVVSLAAASTYRYRLVGVTTRSATIVNGAELEFQTGESAPVVTNKPSPTVGRTTAAPASMINTENSPTTYHLEYGETAAYGKSSTPAILNAAVGATVVTVGLGELRPATLYHYRFVAHNTTGTTIGPDGTFTTTATQFPIVESQAIAQVTQTTATLTARLNGNGLPALYILELGTSTAVYDGQLLGSLPASGEVSLALSGLQPGTTYHFRFAARNDEGTVLGTDQAFTTLGFPTPVLAPPTPRIVQFPSEAKTQARHRATQHKCKKSRLVKKNGKCVKKKKKQKHRKKARTGTAHKTAKGRK